MEITLTTRIKIYIAAVLIAMVPIIGFIIYQQVSNATKLRDIETSIVAQKQLLDGIVRSQSQYATKEQIDDFAKERGLNLDVIQSDLDKLGAQIQGINGLAIVSIGQTQRSVPSTTTEPRLNPPVIDACNDPFGYQRNKQVLALNEKFSNTEVPFGTVGFSAWQDKPWDFTIQERKYLVTSVLGQDENGKHYSYSKFAIQSGGKNYDVKIDDAKFLEEYPSNKFQFFNPRLFMIANGGVTVTKAPVGGEAMLGGAVGIMSWGSTKSNPKLSILQLGAGYGIVNKDVEFSLSPIQINLGNAIPLINNTYVGPTLQVNTKGGVTAGAGISVGL